jgi:hypothetical protein
MSKRKSVNVSVSKSDSKSDSKRDKERDKEIMCRGGGMQEKQIKERNRMKKN